MSKFLPSEVHQEIFGRVKSAFADCLEFDALIADRLKQAISDSNSIEISIKTTKRLAERYYDASAFKTKEQKSLFRHIQLIFKCAYVIILTYHDEGQNMMLKSTDDLLSAFPEFEGIEEEELGYLLNFRNYLKVALLLLPAHLNKDRLMKIAARLEGSQNPEYVTGGGQKAEVDRRVRIYEKEGCIVARKRAMKRKVVEEESLSVVAAAVVAPTEPLSLESFEHTKFEPLPAAAAASVFESPSLSTTTMVNNNDYSVYNYNRSYSQQHYGMYQQLHARRQESFSYDLDALSFYADAAEIPVSLGTSCSLQSKTASLEIHNQQEAQYHNQQPLHHNAMHAPLSLPSPALRSASFINMFETGDFDDLLAETSNSQFNNLPQSQQAQHQQPQHGAIHIEAGERSPSKIEWIVR